MEKELFDYTSAPQTTWNQSPLGSFICNQNCEISMVQSDPFESAFSSIVSSQVASSAIDGGGGENFLIGDLIGRLGTICDYGEISPHSNTSCYNSPLNSLPKLTLSMADSAAVPGSIFRRQKSILENFNWSATSSTAENAELGGSMEGSTLTEQNPGGKLSRNRQNEASEVKAEPIGDIKEEEDGNQNQTKPPKDYIHVRARRGQATDSHSLAERVRREKISQRMNFLQDLVPGSNKVTGKAVMLDEIINYVQSLQREVEFLSMKLATVNPRMDATMEGLLPPFSSDYQALQ